MKENAQRNHLAAFSICKHQENNSGYNKHKGKGIFMSCEILPFYKGERERESTK